MNVQFWTMVLKNLRTQVPDSSVAKTTRHNTHFQLASRPIAQISEVISSLSFTMHFQDLLDSNFVIKYCGLVTQKCYESRFILF